MSALDCVVLVSLPVFRRARQVHCTGRMRPRLGLAAAHRYAYFTRVIEFESRRVDLCCRYMHVSVVRVFFLAPVQGYRFLTDRERQFNFRIVIIIVARCPDDYRHAACAYRTEHIVVQ